MDSFQKKKVWNTTAGKIGTIATVTTCAVVGIVCAVVPGGQLVTAVCVGVVVGAIGGAVSGALNPKFCSVAGTLVMTKQGYKAIEEIK